MRYLLLTLLFFSMSFAFAQKTEAEKVEEKYEMKTYYMVFLKKGPNRNLDSLSSAKLQEAHLANIQRLVDEKKLVLAGPFLDDGDIRGIFVFNAENQELVEKWVNTDPAIQAQSLSAEIHPWYSAKDQCLP